MNIADEMAVNTMVAVRRSGNDPMSVSVITEWDEERLARAALSQVCGAGSLRLVALLAQWGAVETWHRVCAGDDGWATKATAVQPESIAVAAQQHGIRFVIPGDAEWLDALTVLETSAATVDGLGGLPVGLWVRGPLSLVDAAARAVAIVGARAATRYGEVVAQEFASDLADAGFAVVSGGAYGIDAAAHRGALGVGGVSVGVYAQGLDTAYPPGNRRLYEQLCAEQVVLSEAPPGVTPTRYSFLARNRLIAALAKGTIVVEAAVRSGARNTANWTGLLGRILMAVPGSVMSAASLTPNRLIRDGEAALVANAEDALALLADLGTFSETPFCAAARSFDLLTPEQRTVHEALPARGACDITELAIASSLAMPKLQAALTTLELLGLAVQVTDGWRVAR
ncbi:MAG: DNA-processing protein DprA [Propionibacteriaceae bacterium]|nr:DNA-processing protein DprA [Propionibacteriaceae bacterium]